MNRNLKINKDLLSESSDFTLTRRTSKNIRDRLAKQAAYVSNLCESHWVGVGMCNQCKEEIDPFKLNKDDISLIKTLFPNVMQPLSSEDLETATKEFDAQGTIEEISKYLKGADKDTIDQFKARGITITIGKPELKAVNE